jgi:hypothetical protein
VARPGRAREHSPGGYAVLTSRTAQEGAQAGAVRVHDPQGRAALGLGRPPPKTSCRSFGPQLAPEQSVVA